MGVDDMDQFMLVKDEPADKVDKPSAPEKDEVYESPVKKEEKVKEIPLDEKTIQLKKMSDYKTFAKGLMDVALLSANTNQLRQALEQCSTYYWLRICLLCLSIILQVFASIVLIKERLTCRSKDYEKCVKYNAVIGLFVFLIIVINVIISSFGGPEETCVSEQEGSGNEF